MHEFRTTLRLMYKDDNSWPNRFGLLATLESKASKQFLKACSQVLIAFLLLTSLQVDDSLTVKIQSFQASIPVTYFLTATSFLMLITALVFCHLSAVTSLKAREHGKILLPGFSANAYGLISGNDNDFSLGVALYNNFFIKEKLPISSILTYGVLLGLAAALLPLAAFGYLLFDKQLELFLSPEVIAIERIAVLFGMTFIALSFAYVLLFHLPFPVTKNTSQIRWNFLCPLTIGLHPQAPTWLKDTK